MSEEVGENRTLLVCCSAFRVAADAFPNLTLKKIPKAVLTRCEWGRDDYSLSVAQLPPPEPEPEPEASPSSKKPKSKTKASETAATLFEQGGEA